MAFGVLLFAVLAWRSHAMSTMGVGGCLMLAASNVLLMVHGRTGYVVLAGLAVLALHAVFGWRGVVAAVVAITRFQRSLSGLNQFP